MRLYHLWSGNISMSIFSQRLKSLRIARNLTQTRLAQLLEISPRVYNRWEKDAAIPHFDTVVKIADIFNVSLDVLAGRQLPNNEPIIHNSKLHSLCLQIDHLSDEDQQALAILLDSLLKRSQMAKLLAK
jgi:transcriptional regulator with XRE-family HTH domain